MLSVVEGDLVVQDVAIELRHLLTGEGEVGRGHRPHLLTDGHQGQHRDVRLGPGRQRHVTGGRDTGQPASERLSQLRRRPVQVVEVIEDEDERPAHLLDRRHHQVRPGLGGQLLLPGPGLEHTLAEGGEVRPAAGHPVVQERTQVAVAQVQGVPADRVRPALSEIQQERGLAVAGGGADYGDSARSVFGQQVDEPLAADNSGAAGGQRQLGRIGD